VVDYAEQLFGKNCEHEKIYSWARDHIYFIDNGRKISICALTTDWEASIRLNRSKVLERQWYKSAPNMVVEPIAAQERVTQEKF